MKNSLIIGQKFNRCLITGYKSGSKKIPSKYLFKCDCGNFSEATGTSIKRGVVKSCGCLKKEHCGKLRRSHGKYNSSIYKTWASMIQRCANRKNHAYPNYGGRGISVCKRWEKFDNFYADMGVCPAGYSIDRINNNGNYDPKNCRWATNLEQASNTRSNVYLEFNGKRATISEWGRGFSISIAKRFITGLIREEK